MLRTGTHQDHRREGEDDHIGDGAGQRHDEEQPVGGLGGVDGAEDGDPTDQEQRAGDDQTVEEHPAAERSGVLTGEQQQAAHAPTGKIRKKPSATDGNGTSPNTSS